MLRSGGRQVHGLTYVIMLNFLKGLVEVLIHQHHYHGGRGLRSFMREPVVWVMEGFN